MSEKKKVDEDWKKQVRDEQKKVEAAATDSKETAPKPGTGERTPFMEFMNALATEALMFLGAIPHPQTGQAIFAPEQAKQTIDIISMLEEKTKGNLNSDEAEMMKTVLHELRMAYVEATQRAQQPPPPPPA